MGEPKIKAPTPTAPAKPAVGDLSNPATQMMHALLKNVSQVIFGKEEVIGKIICSWVCGGHVLLEDVPGTGKTMLAKALSKSVELPFKRGQFTPDLLPSDLVGANIFNRKTDEFEFRPGPIFTSLFLADEINRATPRTQSALLEAMSERQVTVDGQGYTLDPLFFVIATENPVEQAGTFQLPEAQLDRFHLRIGLGYPAEEAERRIVHSQKHEHPIQKLGPVLQREHLEYLRVTAENIELHEPVLNYVLTIVQRTRQNPMLALGASPRASLALIQLAKAHALFHGHSYVRPDDVQAFIEPVLAHRLVPTADARFAGMDSRMILKEIVQGVTVPVG